MYITTIKTTCGYFKPIYICISIGVLGHLGTEIAEVQVGCVGVARVKAAGAAILS